MSEGIKLLEEEIDEEVGSRGEKEDETEEALVRESLRRSTESLRKKKARRAAAVHESSHVSLWKTDGEVICLHWPVREEVSCCGLWRHRRIGARPASYVHRMDRLETRARRSKIRPLETVHVRRDRRSPGVASLARAPPAPRACA